MDLELESQKVYWKAEERKESPKQEELRNRTSLRVVLCVASKGPSHVLAIGKYNGGHAIYRRVWLLGVSPSAPGTAVILVPLGA